MKPPRARQGMSTSTLPTAPASTASWAAAISVEREAVSGELAQVAGGDRGGHVGHRPGQPFGGNGVDQDEAQDDVPGHERPHLGRQVAVGRVDRDDAVGGDHLGVERGVGRRGHLDDAVDALGRGRPDRRRGVVGPVVHDRRRSRASRQLGLRVGADRRDHVRPAAAAELDREVPDRPGTAGDEHRAARPGRRRETDSDARSAPGCPGWRRGRTTRRPAAAPPAAPAGRSTERRTRAGGRERRTRPRPACPRAPGRPPRRRRRSRPRRPGSAPCTGTAGRRRSATRCAPASRWGSRRRRACARAPRPARARAARSRSRRARRARARSARTRLRASSLPSRRTVVET